MSRRPRIAVTMGDAAGIGPEICLRLLESAEQRKDCLPIVIGDATILKRVASQCQIPLRTPFVSLKDAIEGTSLDTVPLIIDCESFSNSLPKPGQISRETGLASFHYVNLAIDLIESKKIQAVVTGPIHKEAWQAADIPYPGHTELFASRTETSDYCMMMTAPSFSCSLVTTHVGLRDVPQLLTGELIFRVTRLTATALTRILGRRPRLAMLGLNPHAGEGGLFGNLEEEKIIQPAAVMARREGIDITDPLPPDTAFLPSLRQQIDGYICMYHDQGLIPFKAFNFDSGVNITLGLPINRTSVDHGTALDIAGKGIADPSSLFAAVELAAKLASG